MLEADARRDAKQVAWRVGGAIVGEGKVILEDAVALGDQLDDRRGAG